MGRDLRGLIDFAGVGIGLIDFGFSAVETISGITLIAGSPATGPVAPAAISGGSVIAAHGLAGLANSTIDIGNALFDKCSPGLLETLGGTLFGDTGQRVGAATDLFLGARPAALAASGPEKISDVFDLVSGIDTFDDAFSPNECSQ